jgi:hypothetical protein
MRVREPSRYLVPGAIALVAALAIGVPAACQRVEEPSVSPDPRAKPTVVVANNASQAASAAPTTTPAKPVTTMPTPPPIAATATPDAPDAPATCPAEPDPAGARKLFDRGAAAFLTPDGKRHPLRAEIARTPAAQEHGLMFRTAMAPDEAMVFEFAAPHAAQFWMHNTCLALDMVFVGEDTRVIGVVTAPPLNDEPRFVNGFSKWVVELPAGAAARAGIAMGTIFEAPVVPRALP